MVLGALGIGIYKYRSRSLLPANGRAPLYAAEFSNATGDPVFDDVLREIVTNELNRSPSVQVVDADPASLVELLHSTGKAADERLTPELARQLCQRDKGIFFMDGEIRQQGNGYLLDLSVRECGGSELFA